MKTAALRRALTAGILLPITILTHGSMMWAQTLQVLHAFEGPDGEHPEAAPVQGSDGSFYGTTQAGGDTSTFGFGYGTVFKIAPDGIFTTLVIFEDFNGKFPEAALVEGSDANFYGTTEMGGDGYGTIFRMSPDGTLTTLVIFENSNGSSPSGSLIQRSDGNFYGTTYSGGNLAFKAGFGAGTVFKMSMDGTLTTLVEFDGGNGNYPTGSLVQGRDGNFYGTTEGGGVGGYGTVFKMSPTGDLTTLVSFEGTNGGGVGASLVQASDGSLYGTTSGSGLTNGAVCGTVFKIPPDGTLTTLVTFNGINGCSPSAELIPGREGNFYGTTGGGGEYGNGTFFQMTPDGTLTTLVSFGGTNGAGPLVQGKDGNLYGTTYSGGDLSVNSPYGVGTVFRILMPPSSPALKIAQSANQLVLAWPTNAVGFALQSSSDLSSSTNWVDSTDTPFIVADQYVLTNTLSGSARFYRLKK